MNETLSLRLTSDERRDIEATIASAICSDFPEPLPSDFLRVAARLMVRNIRLFADEIAGSLSKRKLSPEDAELVTRRLQSMALALLNHSWVDSAAVYRRFDDLPKPLWLWCVADGHRLRWGTVPAGRRNGAGAFERDLGVRWGTVPAGRPELAEWIFEQCIGTEFSFGPGDG